MLYILNGLIQLLALLLLEDLTTNLFLFSILVIGIQLLSYIFRNKKQSSWLLALLQVCIVYFVFSFSITTSVITAVLFLFTEQYDTPWKKWMIACGILIISIFTRLDLPNLQEWSLFFLQTLLTIIASSQNKKQMTSRLTFIGVFAFISAIPVLLMPAIRYILSHIIGGAALGVGYVLAPILKVEFLSKASEKYDEIQKQSNSDVQQSIPNVSPSSTAYNIILIIVIVAVLLFVYLYRKRLKKTTTATEVALNVQQDLHVRKQKKKKQKAPTNMVRKEIFKLEQKVKQPLQREKGETLADWLTRLHTNHMESVNTALIIQAYEEERYGKEQTTIPFSTFKQEIQKLYANNRKARR